MNGNGITYEDIITNDKIEELEQQLSQLQQEKEELIKWFNDELKSLESMPFIISKSSVIKEFEEGLSKLKGE